MKESLATLEVEFKAQYSSHALSHISLLVGELFDAERSLEVLAKWNGLSQSAQENLLVRNSLVLVPHIKEILQTDLKPSTQEEIVV